MRWCEKVSRSVLPAIRKEIVILMAKNGKKQKEIAEILGITPAAVSQYLKGKRAKVELTAEEKKLIEEVVKKGIKDEDICMLCRKIGERIAGS